MSGAGRRGSNPTPQAQSRTVWPALTPLFACFADGSVLLRPPIRRSNMFPLETAMTR